MIVEHLSENALQKVAPLVDLVFIATSMPSMCPVLVAPHWFVLLQNVQKCLPIVRDRHHQTTLQKHIPAATQVLHSHLASHSLQQTIMGTFLKSFTIYQVKIFKILLQKQPITVRVLYSLHLLQQLLLHIQINCAHSLLLLIIFRYLQLQFFFIVSDVVFSLCSPQLESLVEIWFQVWLAVEREERQQSGVGKKLSEKRLEVMFPLVDLVAVGTGVICECLVLVVPQWFVLSQLRHQIFLYHLDPHH